MVYILYVESNEQNELTSKVETELKIESRVTSVGGVGGVL